MRTAIVLFTRDLRVHDNPALAAGARENDRVLPLFVLDDAVLDTFGAPARRAFLADALHDLDGGLGGLVVRRGDAVAETVTLARELGTNVVHIADDASGFARRRLRRLRETLDVRVHPSTTVVPIDGLPTTAGGAYRVFTPYWRAWQAQPRRAVEETPAVVQPEGVDPGELPRRTSGARFPGGEREGRRRLELFLRDGLDGYGAGDAELAGGTSRLSPYLHFGCLSPLEVASRAAANEAFVRQLCWRDFYLQLLAAYPALPREDLRRGPVEYRDDPEGLAAWREGATGVPVVDAAMRQLRSEGWMPNRARLIVSSFLTKTLRIDWREGAAHFAELLVDGDLASNSGNWQWIAGTGTDTRPHRRLNPTRQALRHDPAGDYVRTHVAELADVPGADVHRPSSLLTRNA